MVKVKQKIIRDFRRDLESAREIIAELEGWLAHKRLRKRVIKMGYTRKSLEIELKEQREWRDWLIKAIQEAE